MLETKLLKNIHSPEDVKALDMDQLHVLAAEIREALFNKLTKKGGHFGPNFGIVETTIALHYVFESPKDKFVWDVSHLSYPHKMLTGRAFAYLDEERFGEISGYSNPEESEHDFFKVGHTSTSVALAEGLAKARDAKGEHGNVIAVIGDGSLSGGLALEALDFAGDMDSNLIIIVNDNEMSIAENHGGLYKNLRELRESAGQAENNLFKAMGLDYKYVEDGNDIQTMIAAFKELKDIDHPIVLHIHTQKGKGYEPAEKNREPWHWCSPFDRATGKPLTTSSAESWQSIVREYFLKKFKEEDSLRLITAGVPGAIGFGPAVRDEAGKHFIDVGIAEEQATTMVAGMAKGGINAVFATNATFMQRAYDELSHDVGINSAAGTFLLFGNSVFGLNDVTHLGLYESAAVSTIPGFMNIFPTSKLELCSALDFALGQNEQPVAIFVPSKIQADTLPFAPSWQTLEEGKKVALVGLGDGVALAKDAAATLKETLGFIPTLVNARINAVDADALAKLCETHDIIVSLEATSIEGGFGQKVAAYVAEQAPKTKFMLRGIAGKFYDRFDANELVQESRLDAKSLTEDISKLLA